MSEYISRKDIDDYGKRNSNKNSYKNRHFDGKRTAKDEYTGQKLYYSKKGIASTTDKGRHYTTETTANVDHVVPIDRIKDASYTKGLSKSEIKGIANSDNNLAVTSEALNKSKNAQSNFEYLTHQLKQGTPENPLTSYNMVKSQVQAEILNRANATTIKAVKSLDKITNSNNKSISKIAKDAGKATGSAVSAGASAAIMSLTVSGLNNIALVAAGEKDIKDATIDTLKDTSASFVGGVGIDLMQKAIIEVVKEGGNKEIVKLLGNGLPIAEISALVMVGNSVIRFVNDEITMEECVTEVIMNGAGAVAYALGFSLGGPAGAIVASVIMAQISKVVLDYRAITKMTEEKLSKVNSIVAEALIEMEYQRNALKDMISTQFTEWDEAFDKGFEEIFVSAMENNADGIANGLDKILNVFGENVRFKNDEEFDAFFDSENRVFSF